MFLLYRATRDRTYAQLGWDLFAGLNASARAPAGGGFAVVEHAHRAPPTLRDQMPAHIFETLKHLYLLLFEFESGKPILSDDWVPGPDGVAVPAWSGLEVLEGDADLRSTDVIVGGVGVASVARPASKLASADVRGVGISASSRTWQRASFSSQVPDDAADAADALEAFAASAARAGHARTAFGDGTLAKAAALVASKRPFGRNVSEPVTMTGSRFRGLGLAETTASDDVVVWASEGPAHALARVANAAVARGPAAERRSCPSVLGFATYFKKPARACRRRRN